MTSPAATTTTPTAALGTRSVGSATAVSLSEVSGRVVCVEVTAVVGGRCSVGSSVGAMAPSPSAGEPSFTWLGTGSNGIQPKLSNSTSGHAIARSLSAIVPAPPGAATDSNPTAMRTGRPTAAASRP